MPVRRFPSRTSRSTSLRRRSAWMRLNRVNLALVAGTAQAFDLSLDYKTANGILATEGYTIVRTRAHVHQSASLVGSMRFGAIIEEVNFSLTGTNGPITQPFRDWYVLGTQTGFGAAAPAASWEGHADRDYDFKSKRKISDIKVRPMFYVESDTNSAVTFYVDSLVLLP